MECFQMVSSKYIFDDGEADEVFMDEWAACSEMTYKELGKLERDFLAAIVRFCYLRCGFLYTFTLHAWFRIGSYLLVHRLFGKN